MVNKNELKEKLNATNLRLTSQRQYILEILIRENDKHLSFEELATIVSKDYPSIGLSTIYRTIRLFEKFNLVSVLICADGLVRYELRLPLEHNHHHLICNCCKKVIDVDKDLLTEIEAMINIKYNFDIVDHSLTFYGICINCQKGDN